MLFIVELGLGVATRLSLPAGFLAGAVTSAPFIAGLLYGGRWLARSELAPERYRRVGWWCLGGLAGFGSLIVGIMLTVPNLQPLSALLLVSTLRWSGSLGAGIGLCIGVFEARTIERALTSQRLRIEQQTLRQERDRLDEFATIVSHDLRNPLQALSLRLELLKDDYDSEHLDKMEDALTRMETIIEDTLTLAREGQAVSDTERINLTDLATQCWERASAAQASLEVEDSLTIVADESRVCHVFENLFQNACLHGGADVTVRVGQLDTGDGFFIEDNGPGIPSDQRATVFDPGETTASDGSGFGLAIVRSIVEAHGWEIYVTESTAGGARFEITNVEVTE